MWCPFKVVLSPESAIPPPEHPGFLRLPVPCLSSLGPWPSPLEQKAPCCHRSIVIGILWQGFCGAVFSQLTSSSSPVVRGQACHLLGVPWTMLAEEMHTNIEWKGLKYFITMVVWNFVYAWPSVAHIKRWKYDMDNRASCKLPPSGVLKTKWPADQQRSLPFGCWAHPGIHCIISSVAAGQPCRGPEDTERTQVWAASSSRRYWW